MKIAVLGGAGVRTPFLLKAMLARQEILALDEVALMDVDADHLDLMGVLLSALEIGRDSPARITRTTDARRALTGADFVITTFRVGGLEARVIDESVPLRRRILGQETTGAGGFAMAMRTLPVLLRYIRLMRQVCPEAWLVNFANPSGLLTQAILQVGGWQRAIGICDAPFTMRWVAASILGAAEEDVVLDYFGLNHLGWIRAILHRGQDCLPGFIDMLRDTGHFPWLPFPPALIASLGMIPNEYLVYYYDTERVVERMLHAAKTRGQELLEWNTQLYADLRRLARAGNAPEMKSRYEAYLRQRARTHLAAEAGSVHDEARQETDDRHVSMGGYAGAALEVIEGLTGARPRLVVANVANEGAIHGMGEVDVVEIPVHIGRDLIRPLAVGSVPEHGLRLMQRVKQFEQLTISAAVEGSYEVALRALTTHPLVPDPDSARAVLDEYLERHGHLFPELT